MNFLFAKPLPQIATIIKAKQLHKTKKDWLGILTSNQTVMNFL